MVRLTVPVSEGLLYKLPKQREEQIWSKFVSYFKMLMSDFLTRDCFDLD